TSSKGSGGCDAGLGGLALLALAALFLKKRR
nr:SYNERG-CTERM sorting domain-containing protein [Fretibacterium sp.]